MRKITLYQKGADNVELLDDSDVNIDEYCNELSKLFQLSNIAILKTTSSVFLVRPSKLTGINVEELQTENEPKSGPDFEEAEKASKQIGIDIITDMD